MANSSFRAITKAYNIQDLQQYRKLILTCPGIDEYVIFRSHQTGYSFKILKGIEPDVKHETEKQLTSKVAVTLEKQEEIENTGEEITEEPTNDTETITTTLEFNTPEQEPQYNICYGKDSDFETMLQAFWPKIARYIHGNPSHDHSKQWQQWINQGLHSGTDLTQFKQLLGVISLEQIYLFLRDSPAINQHFDIIWNHKIHYKVKDDKAIEYVDRTDANNQSNSPLTIHNSVTGIDTIDFGIFHQTVFNSIDGWAHTDSAKNHPEWINWIKLTWAGLKAVQPAQTITKILKINNIRQYINIISVYPPM